MTSNGMPVMSWERFIAAYSLQPTDYKPVSTWGIGVIEIRLTGEDGEYRVVYVAKFDEAIYVLHAFDKKTQQTSPRDVNIFKARYKAVLAERRKM
ncbi:type II toxin-antitoxin system RelE/ParE family toxin [Raoultella sp. R2A007]|uniref:type II toxin-antitoxin system RelE/ParE family toxin n=1 Tax=Raoultella sp. R2A007 TaxID=3416669 RepID=UPI003CEA3952